jgi:hypothetical protein
MLMIKGYENRIADQWKQTRAIEYKIYEALTDEKDRATIYEFRPLPNDPTAEEIALAKKEKEKQKINKWKDRIESVKNHLLGKSSNKKQNA